MLNTLTKFEKLMQEHEVIQANTNHIACVADNLLTLFNLQDDSVDFNHYQVNYLSDKRVNLKRAINSLRDGLLDHNLREEEAILPLAGDSIFNAIKLQHREVIEKIDEIDWMLLNIGPMGLLFNSCFLKQKVDDFCSCLNSACIRENSVMELLSR